MLGLAIACLFCGRMLVRDAADIAGRHHLYSRGAHDAVAPEYILASSLLGGFRSLFITGLWVYAQEKKQAGRYYEMADVYRVISTLQPSHASAWRFQAWDLTYNVAADFPDDREDRVFWVFRGIDLLRKEAIRRNQKSPELYWELAWYFRHKLGSDFDESAPYYRAHLTQQIENALRGLPPEEWKQLEDVARVRRRFPTRASLVRDRAFAAAAARIESVGTEPRLDVVRDAERLLEAPPSQMSEIVKDPQVAAALQTARLWSLGERIEENLGMDAASMFTNCEEFGPLDWRDPATHTLYWARLGEEVLARVKPHRLTTRYRYLAFRAAMDLVYTPDALSSGHDWVFFLLEETYVESVMSYCEKTLDYFDAQNPRRRRRHLPTVNVDAMRRTYSRLLRNCAINAQIQGMPDLGNRALERLRQLQPGDTSNENRALAEFTQRELIRCVETLGREDTRALIKALFLQACRDLVEDRPATFRRRLVWTHAMYRIWAERWEDVPSLEDVQVEAVYDAASGDLPLRIFPSARATVRLLALLQEDLPSLHARLSRELHAVEGDASSGGQAREPVERTQENRP